MARATFLGPHEMMRLRDFGGMLRVTFRGEVPYQVGSSLARADFRDVDVRIILPDDDVTALGRILDVKRLNVLLSGWGGEVTGLPIDCQIQGLTEANAIEGRRNALLSNREPSEPSELPPGFVARLEPPLPWITDEAWQRFLKAAIRGEP